MHTLLVTGGAGFIGGNFVLDLVGSGEHRIINLDALTYAGNLDTLASLERSPHHKFVRGDIGDRELVAQLLKQYQPSAIVNFAAESHVDRSIDGPGTFIQTNVVGTMNLLQAALGLGNPPAGVQMEPDLQEALGFAITIMVIGKKSLLPWFIGGFFAVLYLKVDIMAMAIFGTCVAFLIKGLAKNEGAA